MLGNTSPSKKRKSLPYTASTIAAVLIVLFLFSSPSVFATSVGTGSSAAPTVGCSTSCVYVGTYVASSPANISVIQGTKVLTTIHLKGIGGIFGVIYDAKAKLIIAANYGANSVLEINPATNKVVKSIAVTSPAFMALAPNGLVYIAQFDQTSYITLNVTTGKLGTPITACGLYPEFLAYNPKNGMIYAPDRTSSGTSGCLDIINAKTGKVTTITSFGVNPTGVTVNLATGLVYISDFESSSVTQVVYVVSGTKLVKTITSTEFSNARLWGMWYSPANKEVYVAATNLNQVIPISSKNVVGAPINVGTGPDYGCYVATSKTTLVTNTHETTPPAAVNLVSSANKVTKTISLGPGQAGPYGCAES